VADGGDNRLRSASLEIALEFVEAVFANQFMAAPMPVADKVDPL
jgi:hypothetical protein